MSGVATSSSSGESVRRSLIVPVYRNASTIPALLDVVERLNEQLGGELELVVVVDGSPDDSYEQLAAALPERPFRSHLVRHARNFGSIAAVRTGLSVTDADQFAVMAADLQEPPELILDFFRELDNGRCALVVGRRESRDDPALSKHAANTFWATYQKVVQPEMPTGGIDVFAGTRVVRDQLVALRELNTSLVGQLLWLGFPFVAVPYSRLERADGGRSGWTFRRKLRYMFDSIYGFSALPIQAVTMIGLVGAVVCLTVGVITVIGRITGGVNIKGYAALMVVLVGCTSLILVALGIVGNYVWRSFENSKGRPHAVVDEERKYGNAPRTR